MSSWDPAFVVSKGQSFRETVYPAERRIPDEEIGDKLKELDKGRKDKIPLNFIGFQMRADDEGAGSSIARRTGGKLRQIKK